MTTSLIAVTELLPVNLADEIRVNIVLLDKVFDRVAVTQVL